MDEIDAAGSRVGWSTEDPDRFQNGRFLLDAEPFEALCRTILPELIEARSRERSLTIWSLACSTGQEPYSLAIMVREHFPTLMNWRLRIIAADVSGEVLGQARSGVYTPQEVERGVPASLRVKYFDQEGATFRARPELRGMIEFRQLNLAERVSLTPRADLVFLRNAMNRFDVAMRAQILREVATQIMPDGYLLLDDGDSLPDPDVPFDALDIEGTVCFRAARGRRAFDVEDHLGRPNALAL